MAKFGKTWFGAIFVLVIGLGARTQAALPFSDYLARVTEASAIAQDVSKNDYGRSDELRLLERISALLPATEDVSRDNETIHVDNSWVLKAITSLEQDDESLRAVQLTDLAGRLKALEQNLKPTGPQARSREGQSQKLAGILAREDYQSPEKKESSIKGWLRSLKDKIAALLRKLFSSQAPDQPQLQSRSYAIFQIFLVLALMVILLWSAATLIGRFLRKRKDKEELPEPETREVLGEVIDPALSADDLLREARELAFQGKYRYAIRRAYIASLFALEQKGRIRLHRAKTNRDYLRELKFDSRAYPVISGMTASYEKIWYGNHPASQEDYSGFAELSRQVESLQ